MDTTCPYRGKRWNRKETLDERRRGEARLKRTETESQRGETAIEKRVRNGKVSRQFTLHSIGARLGSTSEN